MFCVNCGEKIDEGELICKGCGGLSPGIREELLAFSEKENIKDADLKCDHCGSEISAKYRFCNTCGKPIAS